MYTIYKKGMIKLTRQGRINLYYKAQRAWHKILKDVATGDDMKLYMPWKKFEHFREWYENNYYETESNKLSVIYTLEDKNCKEISPKTCILIPSELVPKIEYLQRLRPFSAETVTHPCGGFQMPYKELIERFYTHVPEEVYTKLYNF